MNSVQTWTGSRDAAALDLGHCRPAPARCMSGQDLLPNSRAASLGRPVTRRGFAPGIFSRVGFYGDTLEFLAIRSMTLAGVPEPVAVQNAQQRTLQSLADVTPDHPSEPLSEPVAVDRSIAAEREHDVPQTRAFGAPDDR